MKSLFSMLSEFWDILWGDTRVFDKVIIASGAAASPALTFSHVTSVIGWLVGICTIIFTILRIRISIYELQDRRRKRKGK